MAPASAAENEPVGAARPAPALWLVFLVGFVAPAVVLFWDSFARDRNLAYRDAAHFYYPYYKLIALEWSAGRLPLWNPYENGGEPLAAQPTAAVFYPGKAVFFALPYALAFKIYHVAHVLLAWWATFWCARRFGVGRVGAACAGTAYAFGGYVLFQLYNVVFLVGAAWLPLGVAAWDRLVRRGDRFAVLAVAAVLALQILGGDPEVAVVTLVAGLPYLLLYHLGSRAWRLGVGLSLVGHGVVYLGAWWPPLPNPSAVLLEPTWAEWSNAMVAEIFAYPDAVFRGFVAQWNRTVEMPFGWNRSVHAVKISAGWSPLVLPVVGVVLLLWGGGWRQLWKLQPLRLAVVAAVLAGALAAVQILPSRELVKVSDRAAPKAPHEAAAFSLFPARLAELALPTVFGKQMPTHSRWAPFGMIENGLWTPALYMGLPTLVFALAVLASRRVRTSGILGETATRRWIVLLTVLALWCALGKFGGAYWLFDPYAGVQNPTNAPRDFKLYGLTDGLYRLCEETVPMFASFRYPEKLFVFVALGLALLAAAGVERLSELRLTWFVAPAALGGLLAAAAFFGHGAFVDYLAKRPIVFTGFGPLDAEAAWRSVWWAALHLLAVGAALAFVRWRRMPALAVLALLAGDVTVANRWLVLTEPQAAIDAKPKLLEVIEKAEAEAVARTGAPPQPYRIHRTRIYSPMRWNEVANPDRVAEMSDWERDTLQPKYGLPWGLEYVSTAGTMAMYDVEFFFAPWTSPTPPELKALGAKPDRITYFPRNGYNQWGAKYFVLPRFQPLDHEERGVYTMTSARAGGREKVLAESSADADDYVVLLNSEARPRAWIVHHADFRPPIVGLEREDRKRPMEDLLARDTDGGVRVWLSTPPEYPIDSQAMLEIGNPQKVAEYCTGGPTQKTETVRFDKYTPGRIEIAVAPNRPGFLVVANAYYPGWSATVDGKPAPILRANRAMQAIPLPAGAQRVVLEYRCRPLVVGGFVSAAAWLAVAWFGMRSVRGVSPAGN